MQRELHFTANYNLGLGLHPARWRLIDNPAQFLDVKAHIEVAQIAEKAGFDAVFLSDFQSLPMEPPVEPWHALDPLLALSAIAARTESVGLIATVSTTFSEPYELARKLSSLDHISGGRAAWNIVTSYLPEAGWNFGMDLPSHDDRYERAEEFVSVAKALWAGWGDGALLLDQAGGTFVDWKKVSHLNHVGKHFKVRGPLQVPTSPQGKPILVQAGSSEVGLSFGARHADLIYSLQTNLEAAQAGYRRTKDAVRKAGRDPDRTLFMPGIYPVVGSTEEEALRKVERLDALRDLAADARWFGIRLGVPLGGEDLDKPAPTRAQADFTPAVSTGISESTWQMIERRPGATLREILLSSQGRNRFIAGTPEKVADEIELWFRSGAADGFNVSATHFPDGFSSFTESVIPILQRRGIFRSEYRHSTLRGNLGLGE
ncbi:NtaA/DmoA family FMN-dependent monooxygenase [Agrobacterium tumefaciens]|uniref:Nitrilotriacetate monooxygenase n=1 Tax=Agrobacterium tumefaciens TaxID=358 RepID=A0A2Z2Q1A9_AGRTU|nr:MULTISPECIES: NtaA/DmoA family FMN-dependent monooxygenase [Agrobacterium tumefaciens complex]ASK48211.1 nitrilotriacetate monooxygenase [Agrobacterium radiobacter]AYM84822.1 LLM class flavin-dependent oxidoreductase [Agrobacterium tumefaciens]NTE95057.1 NtaA/DmoA family FMN-dependent monooxygenase [Agrobacterium tumefaciens]QCL98395.1 NtaA/DmoA family FMN-dependent monooxygenase [Agrobacterium tumefaciens]